MAREIQDAASHRDMHHVEENARLKAAVEMLHRITGLMHGPEGDEIPEGIVFPPMIAGGAARDLLLGREVKDFDIFWPIHKPYLIDAVADITTSFAEAGYGFMRKNGLRRDYNLSGYLRPEMLGVLSPANYPADVDIVLFDAAHGTTPEQVASTFDTSICRCWLELHEFNTLALVKGVGDFWKSIEQKTIWTYPMVQTRVSHLARVAEKFPDYRLWIVDPDMRKEYDAYMSRDLLLRNQAVA